MSSPISLVVTDPNRVDLGEMPFISFDHAHGDDENTFTLQAYADDFTTDRGGLVYVDGTEYGGIIDNKRITLDNSGARVVTYSGRTFEGILANLIITPLAGEDYFVISGEANAALAEVIEYLNIGDTFTASTAASGITMDAYPFRRFTNAYDGLRRMLAAASAVLHMTYDHTTQRVILSAEPRTAYPELSIDEATITLESKRAYNHVVVGGTGELAERVVVHRYADTAGNISAEQTQFGADEYAHFYDYTTADRAEAVNTAEQWLANEQTADRLEIVVTDESALHYYVDDVVPVSDAETGTEAAGYIRKKVLRVDALGRATVQYSTDDLREVDFDIYWPPVYYDPTTGRLQYGQGGDASKRVYTGPGGWLYYGEDDDDYAAVYRGADGSLFYILYNY